MHQVCLQPTLARDSQQVNEVRKASLAFLKGLTAYNTVVNVGDIQYLFLTTSGDLQLYLSSLGEEGRHHLAQLLVDEFAAGNCTALLLYIDEDLKKGILVTLQTKSDARMSFHLSPAY